jgi:two-component system response regulator YesN
MHNLQTSFHSLPPSSPFSKGRVLIVDDEENVTNLLQRSLTRLEPGLEVWVANSGVQALDLLNDKQLDLLITDYQMPAMNGLELTEAVRQRYPQVKVILMTACPSPQINDLADRLAVDDCLVKPFSSRDLREIVRQLLASAASFSPSPGSDQGENS